MHVTLEQSKEMLPLLLSIFNEECDHDYELSYDSEGHAIITSEKEED